MLTRRTFFKSIAATAACSALRNDLWDIPTQFQLANDPLRPQFHLLPARNWMNDPDGPIYWQGHFHMFFQYNPHAAVWGDMHWAHAVSDDMLHWKHLPIALAPTPNGPDADGCFTGSAVIHQGAATFLYTSVRSVPPGEATLRDGRHNFLETQSLATSRDPDLRTWQKHPAPVLLPPHDPKLAGFRDPCLWREENAWYMGVGSGQHGGGGRVLLYRSADLRNWEFLHALAQGESAGGDATDAVDAGDMWECPDFFPLGGKHVLLYSTQRKVFWEVGEYDPKEHRFHPQKRGLLDRGAYYAPKSQLDAKGRRILWGWIPETRPESEFSAAGWAGCMSLPRVLTIVRDGELSQGVIPEIASLHSSRQKWHLPDQLESLRAFSLAGPGASMLLCFDERPFNLSLGDATTVVVEISYDPSRAGRELEINSKPLPIASRPPHGHHLQLLLDASVIECFADETLALTTRVYRAPQSPLRFTISSADPRAVYSLSVEPCRPISPDRLST
jgi:beta-fructofuranosidase